VSLIIGALKRAQQLRLREIKRFPFFQDIQPAQKRKRKGWAFAWMAFAIGLAALFGVFFVGGKSPSSVLPQAQEGKQPLAHSEPKPSLAAQEHGGQELSRNPSSPARSKEAPIHEQTLTQKMEGPLIKTPVKQENATRIKTAEANPDPQGTVGGLSFPLKQEEVFRPPSNPSPAGDSPRPLAAGERGAPPPPPSTLKEEPPQPSWVIKGGGGNEAARLSEVLGHFNQGVHFYNQRETSKAIQAYQKVLEIDPTYVEAHNNLGLLYQEMGHWEEARKSYQMALVIKPDYEKGLNNLGILCYLQAQDEESMDAFQKVLAVNPQNVEGHINLGVLFKKRGQLDQAAESFQRALALNPLRGEIHYNLGLVYEQAQKIGLAIEHYQAFINLSAKTHPALVREVRQHVNRLWKTEIEAIISLK
jgi:tetratricopeptide (TPR) repeat protein